MRWRATSAVLGFAAVVVTAEARAALPSVWYRGSGSCPDGPSFLSRLESRGVAARLAEVGDRVDFVVTLGDGSEQSSGRLERQTEGGTIAIREVEGANCDAVADALALSLALAHDPAASVEPEALEPAPPAQESSAPLPAVSEPAASEPAAATFSPPASSSTRAPKLEPVWSVGFSAQAWDAFEGPWLMGASPFVGVEAPGSFVLPHATLRVAVQAAFRPDSAAPVQLWIVAGRLEGCPIGWVWERFALRPCLALDAGGLSASAAGVSDVGAWFSGAAHARFEIAFGRLSLEAQAGGLAPLSQYEIAAPSAAILDKTTPVGFSAGLGAYFRIE